MGTYICENVFIPLRIGPTHKSEMLSQVLFGEKYRITDEAGHWMKIETLFDNYAGWIDKNHLQQTADNGDAGSHVLKRSLLCHKSDGTKLVLEAGCEIYSPDFERGVFSAGDNTYTFNDSPTAVHLNEKESVADTALKLVNSPYLWGGRIPSGIDCSGFTQLVYKLHDIKISRDCWKQAEEGKTITFIEEARPGDLVFFDDEFGKIVHTGIIISNGLVIHASGRVRIDIIDHQGIYKKEIKAYSHKLRTIKRLLD
jgi:cell wall-associated NlpC family hydrolase